MIELVKNKTYYENQYSSIGGSFNEALRRGCTNNSLSGLYEVVALATVLQCEVQSVYPYIDYQAGMKSMNAVYKPLGASNLKNGRIVIFWTNYEDQASIRERSGKNTVWSPNHFVPLIKTAQHDAIRVFKEISITPEVEYRLMQRDEISYINFSFHQTPRKTTVKNNQTSSIRSPEFSPPPNFRRQKTSVIEYPSSSRKSYLNSYNDDSAQRHIDKSIENELQSEITAYHPANEVETYEENEDDQERSLNRVKDQLTETLTSENGSEQQRNAQLEKDRQRKRISRQTESVNQRNASLAYQQKLSSTAKLNEDVDHREARLDSQRKRSASNRSSRSEQRQNVRLTNAGLHTDRTKSSEKQQNTTASVDMMDAQSQQQILERREQGVLDQYVWPAPISTQLKDRCLQDFCDHMSMSVLRQTTCIICNARASSSTMKECALQDIPNSERLCCHTDLINIIPGIRRVSEGVFDKYAIVINILSLRFLTDNLPNSSFFSLSNAVFYKKGYNATTKSGTVCQTCYNALVKDKIPAFSAANKVWIGDVPLVLQQLTIAEEKL